MKRGRKRRIIVISDARQKLKKRPNYCDQSARAYTDSRKLIKYIQMDPTTVGFSHESVHTQAQTLLVFYANFTSYRKFVCDP